MLKGFNDTFDDPWADFDEDDEKGGPLADLVGLEAVSILGGVVGFWGGISLMGMIFLAVAAYR